MQEALNDADADSGFIFESIGNEHKLPNSAHEPGISNLTSEKSEA